MYDDCVEKAVGKRSRHFSVYSTFMPSGNEVDLSGSSSSVLPVVDTVQVESIDFQTIIKGVKSLLS